MLVNEHGQPILSEKGVVDSQTRGAMIWEKVVGVLNAEKVTPDELADMVANLFNQWSIQCSASLYQQQVQILMVAMTKILERNVQAKQVELKIRANMQASTAGAELRQ